jgi:phosphonoacetaldehyde hydrolase
MWTIGVTKTGNELGLSLAEVERLPQHELASRLQNASQRMLQAGAHFVIEEVTQLPPVVEAIAGLLARGERP